MVIATGVALSCPLLPASCGETESDDQHTASRDAELGFDPMPVDGSACRAVVQRHPIESTAHVPTCSPIEHATNPPSSGNHYDTWSVFGEYELPLPRGFWIHNMEHGAVVVAYNCPTGCPTDLSAARAWLQKLGVDRYCMSQGELVPRAILVPDPLLDTRWAAAAWGFTLRADCFEPAVFQAFYSAHVGQGPENICTGLIDFRAPEGGLIVPADCGSPSFDAGASDASSADSAGQAGTSGAGGSGGGRRDASKN